MPVTIRPFGILKAYIDGKNECIVEAGKTVRQTMLDLGIPPDVVALVTVNDEQQRKDYVLQEGEVVKLIAVVGGG
jgi:sulfur carrier protein ThiS